MAEPVKDKIIRLEDLGFLEAGCPGCEVHYESLMKTGEMAFAPGHKVKERCESGQRPHCTCDACW